MGKFNQDALLLLDYVGGSENIAAVTHCATRMRFVLNDPSKAEEDKIEEIPSVRGIFTNAGQFQVIIGNEVPTFYQEFMSVAGIQGGTKEEIKSAAKQNQNMLQRAVTMLAEIFTPLLPAIIVGGLILGFRNILEAVPMGFLDGKTITESSTFWNGVNGFLWLPGEAILVELYRFIPVTTPDGEQGYQPSRMWVAEGPRWLLRGIVYGQAAVEDDPDSPVVADVLSAFRQVIVRRGDEAMAPGDLLPLHMPSTIAAADEAT